MTFVPDKETKRAAGEKVGISLVLPAHNEEKYIYRMSLESASVLEKTSSDFEIIIVDDGSTDDTPSEIARAVSESDRITAVTLSENQGKGNALRRGFQKSKMDLVCFLDGDLDLHPSNIETLLSEMGATGADIVIGSKRHPESRLNYPWHRKLYSTIYYMLILVLFRLPVKDTQTGVKLFRREVLGQVFPRMVGKKYTLDLELLAVANRMGYSIAEAPINLTFQGKYRHIRWVDIRNIIVDTLAIFYRLHILKYYDSPLKPTVREEPRISILIPAGEMTPMLTECILKCHEVNYSNYDIRVVADEAADIELKPPGSKVIVSGPAGQAKKRNIGASDSDAEIIAFVDCDAWPDPDWLRNAVPYFSDENVAAVCGPAVTPEGDSRRQQASGFIYMSSLVSSSTTYKYSYHALRDVDDYPASNMIVRRAVLLKAGGFPEEYLYGEDILFCLKLTRDLGKKIVYVPNVVVYKHRLPVYLPHLKQVYSFGVHRGFFVRKFPQISHRLQYFMPSLFLLTLIAGFGLSFASPVVLYAYLAFIGFYLLLVFLSSIKSLDLLLDLQIFPGIIATQLVYGVAFLRGLFSRSLKQD